MIIVKNKNNELIPTITIMGEHICIDYRKLNKVVVKTIFPSLHLTKCLRGYQEHYFFYLNGYSAFFQTPVYPSDKKRSHLHVHMVLLHVEVSHSGCAIPPLPFNIS